MGTDQDVIASRRTSTSLGHPFRSFFSSLRNRQSVPSAMIFRGLLLVAEDLEPAGKRNQFYHWHVYRVHRT